MPQVDLESLVSVCAGGSLHDRKIACEETLPDAHLPEHGGNQEPDQPEVTTDFPPESYWLSKDAERDWFDRNAFYERKDSTKGGSNSTNLNPISNSSSRRLSVNFKSATSIFSLPNVQKSSYLDSKSRRVCKTQLFPKRSRSIGKADSTMVEPASPKVSCMGRVRSMRDRSRNRTSKPSASRGKAAEKKTKRGLFDTIRSVFRIGRRPAVEPSTSPFTDSPPQRTAATTNPRGNPLHDADIPVTESLPRKSVEGEPPSLGGIKRFASGRRSGSSDAVDSGIHVA